MTSGGTSTPPGFKPSGIDKSDRKVDPNLWLRRYSTAIEAFGGDDKAKILFFTVVMDASPLICLDVLPENSIESWHGMKKEFVNNF